MFTPFNPNICFFLFWRGKRVKRSGSEEWLWPGLNKIAVRLCGFLHLHYGRRAIFYFRYIAKSQVASKQSSALLNIFMHQVRSLYIFLPPFSLCNIQMLETWMLSYFTEGSVQIWYETRAAVQILNRLRGLKWHFQDQSSALTVKCLTVLLWSKKGGMWLLDDLFFTSKVMLANQITGLLQTTSRNSGVLQICNTCVLLWWARLNCDSQRSCSSCRTSERMTTYKSCFCQS